jgi:Uma2 family endonuclease
LYNPDMAVHLEPASPPGPLSRLGPYRDADYRTLPEEPRCELLFGRLVLTPGATFEHGEVVALLASLLRDHVEGHGGRLAVAPVDVALAEHSVVQPDLIWVSRERAGRVGARVEGAPDLVIEVLSPSTAQRDRGEKLALYAAAGVTEYWLVDPDSKLFEFLVLGEGRYEVHLPLDGTYRSPAIAGLTLDVDGFWRRLEA